MTRERLTVPLLLVGSDAGGIGEVVSSNDDHLAGSGSRLSSVQLAPGRYTIEATTAVAGAVGDYDLVVTALLADGFGPFF